LTASGQVPFVPAAKVVLVPKAKARLTEASTFRASVSVAVPAGVALFAVSVTVTSGT
jgi:hypothetical protein